MHIFAIPVHDYSYSDESIDTWIFDIDFFAGYSSSLDMGALGSWCLLESFNNYVHTAHHGAYLFSHMRSYALEIGEMTASKPCSTAVSRDRKVEGTQPETLPTRNRWSVIRTLRNNTQHLHTYINLFLTRMFRSPIATPHIIQLHALTVRNIIP